MVLWLSPATAVLNPNITARDQQRRRLSMDAIYHWAGVALALLVCGWACVGFWRGLSLKPTNPETRQKVPDVFWWGRS
jgi:hypothetical protein